MPNPDLSFRGATEASGCSVVRTNVGVAICFHDRSGKVFAYAMLDDGAALGVLASAQVTVMEYMQGVVATGEVGHG